MSACIRRLYSSDHWAPGFDFSGGVDLGAGGLLSDRIRGATFSLRVGRGDVELGLLIGS